jgi:hypothetical protein
VRLENFMTFARSRSFREAWTSEDALWETARELLLPFLDERENPRLRKLRLIGVRAEKLSRGVAASGDPSPAADAAGEERGGARD